MSPRASGLLGAILRSCHFGKRCNVTRQGQALIGRRVACVRAELDACHTALVSCCGNACRSRDGSHVCAPPTLDRDMVQANRALRARRRTQF